MRRLSRRNHAGFTLIELLVAISIIAILVGLLLPSLQKARMAANVIKDQTGLRSVGQNVHLYAADQNGMLPPGPSEYGNNLANNYNVWASGRGVWGAMGSLHTTGFPANVAWKPKGLGILSVQYDMNPDWLFDNYRESINVFPDYYTMFKYIAINRDTVWSSANGNLTANNEYTNTFTYPPGRLTSLGAPDPIPSNHATWGVKNSGQSHLESDFFYRCGDYSTYNATFTAVATSSVSASNARIDAAGFSKKTFLTNCRVWYQGRPSRQYAQGIGYDMLFGDTSVGFFKGGDGNPSTNPTAYALFNGFTSGTITGAFAGQPNNQSGQVIFARADAYFNR